MPNFHYSVWVMLAVMLFIMAVFLYSPLYGFALVGVLAIAFVVWVGWSLHDTDKVP